MNMTYDDNSQLINPSQVSGIIKQYLELNIIDIDNLSKKISIFPGLEYDILYYSQISDNFEKATCLVLFVFEDQIKVKIRKKYSLITNENKPIIAESAKCNCVLNPNDIHKYDEPIIEYIAIKNISSISYKKNKVEVSILLLGISATIVKAVIVRLEFFEDTSTESTKYVELEGGKNYKITHKTEAGETVEGDYAVLAILCEKYTPLRDIDKNCIIRENVRMNNYVYNSAPCSKDDFMTSPPVKNVIISVKDLSEKLEDSELVTSNIYLDKVLDCTLLPEQNIEGDIAEGT